MWPFADFEYGFRSSWSTAVILTVVSHRIARGFVLGYLSSSTWYIWHAGLPHNTDLGLMEFQTRYLALFLVFSVIDSFEWLWIGSLHKNIQLMSEFLKSPFLVLHFSYYTSVTFLMMLSVIWTFMLMILLSISKCDQESDLWKQLELASELESDLQGTVDWGSKWLVNFNAGKTELVLFCLTSLITLVLWCGNGWVLRKNHLWRCWDWLSLLSWIEALTLSLLLKLPPRKLEP